MYIQISEIREDSFTTKTEGDKYIPGFSKALTSTHKNALKMFFPLNNHKMTDTIIKSKHNRALETIVYALNTMALLIIRQKLHKKSHFQKSCCTELGKSVPPTSKGNKHCRL